MVLSKNKKGVYSVLSPLEAEVISVLWKKDSMLVRDIHAEVRKTRKVALTSIAVILDRLYKKNLVARSVETCRGGTHYIYSAKTTETDFERSVMESAVNRLIDSFGPAAVSYFNERFQKGK